MPVDEEIEPKGVESAPAERTNEELDALADSSNGATNRDRPMTAEAEKPAAKAKEETYEFTHNGKTVKGTREQVLKWASQGYNYPQLAQKLNQDKTKWEQDRQAWEKKWQIYREIDDYAAKNTDWWKLVEQSWKTRTAGVAAPGAPGADPATAANDPYAVKFQTLEQKLSRIEQIASEYEEQKALALQQQEDQALDTEIQSFRKQHAELDWDTLDENGKSLETKVLEHGSTNGIKSFRAAARDLLHDDLVAKAASQGKLAVAKGIQNRTKLGVLGETPTSMKSMLPSKKEIRKTSYEDLEREIREELRMGRS